jgi:hypothetical protein
MSDRRPTARAGRLASLTAVALLLLLALGVAIIPWIIPDQDGAAHQLAAIGIFTASYLHSPLAGYLDFRSIARAWRWSAHP